MPNETVIVAHFGDFKNRRYYDLDLTVNIENEIYLIKKAAPS